MKISKNLLLIYVMSILIIVAAVVFTLLDALIPLNIWVHPALNFIFCLCIGFGMMSIILAFIKKSTWHFFVSAILLNLALFYVIIQYLPWWIGLIIVGSIISIVVIFSLIIAGNKTEDIALNKSSDYKNYKERKLPKSQSQEEKLPELKSFKD